MANNPLYSGSKPSPPPSVGSSDSLPVIAPSTSFQFRPAISIKQPQQFTPVSSQFLQSTARGGVMMTSGLPSHPRPSNFMPSDHLSPVRPGQHADVQPLPQAPPAFIAQPTRNITSDTSVSQPYIQSPSNYMLGLRDQGTPSSTSYPMPAVQHQTRQINGSVDPAGSQLGSSIANMQPVKSEEIQTDWIAHTSANGRRYFFNKRTRQSTWEKPQELMTPYERADATTNWKEHTSPDGRKYYYNKVTKESKWSMPNELKIAREQVDKASSEGLQGEVSANSAAVLTVPAVSPAISPLRSSTTINNASGAKMAVVDTLEGPAAGKETAGASTSVISTIVPPMLDKISSSPQNGSSLEEVSAQDSEELVRVTSLEESKKEGAVGETADYVMDEKSFNQEPVAYANKLEAKDAFKQLLMSANVGSDWTWEQAMRIIINDRRYGALKTLGERKHAFNEFMIQKKKEKAEEKRKKEKQAREEFKKMLEDCTELTSSMRWSKAISMFEDDERFKVVEREKERRDIFENYIVELKEKERLRAQEERKCNILEYRKYLESCDFVKLNTQWRRVKDRLQADERCSRLEEMDRLEIFQEYLVDLEREEEEKRKIQKEELRKADRKNRDEFRKLMDDHITEGILTAKTSWRDYCMMVQELPVYLAVASNTTGASPKELFEDVAEELGKQFHEDKLRVKDALKLRKITLTSASVLEDLKVAIADDISSPLISDVNLKLAFNDMLERAREKEVKETKRRKRLADSLVYILRSYKEITASSTWEDCKDLIEGNQECSSLGDETFRKDTFEEYVSQLKVRAEEKKVKINEEKALAKEKDKEERESRRSKHGREKERSRERDRGDHHKRPGHDYNDDKRHRNQHQNAINSNEDETENRKDHYRRTRDHKKSRRHGSTAGADGESREKRAKREHHNGGYRNDLEEGEFGN